MKRMLKFVMVPVLVALAISALPIQMGYGQEPDAEDQNVVEKLLGLFEKANATVYGVLSRVNETVPLPGVVWEKYDTGLAKAKEAMQLIDAGDNLGAKAKALEAMQKMKEVMLDIADDAEAVETDEEREARKAAGIEDAIERINARIANLEVIAANAEARGIDASQIRERLGNVTKLLTKIREHIEAGDIDEAAKDMNMSQRWFGEAMAALRPIVDANKLVQAGNFLDMCEGRLTRITDMIPGILDKVPIPDIAKNIVTQRMQTAQDKIAEVRSLLQEGRISDAIPKFGELRADIANLMAEVKQRIGTDVGEASENIDRYEIALDVLEDRAEMLEGKGVDVTDLLTKIQEARKLIQSAVGNLEEGKLTELENILAQIDDLIEEATSLADQLAAEAESS